MGIRFEGKVVYYCVIYVNCKMYYCNNVLSKDKIKADKNRSHTVVYATAHLHVIQK